MEKKPEHITTEAWELGFVLDDRTLIDYSAVRAAREDYGRSEIPAA